jgi:hypothetical protein
MSKKRATVLVYRSDRNLWADGPLRCRVIDLFGSSGPRVLLTRSIPPAVELDLDLPFDAAQAYGISIDADGHRSGWHVLTRRSFLRPEGAGQREGDATIIRPMLVHKDAEPSDLAAAFKSLEIQGSPFATFGARRFDALQPVAAKLAFLNLEAKLRETRIGTRSLLSYVRVVSEVSVDRVFLFMAAELRPLVDDSSEFSDAPGHGAPAGFPGLPAHPDSWKHTKFDFGNLQVSFSTTAVPQPANAPEPCFSVDCDIDLERDLGHAFEFIHNQVFKKTTDQTLVYRMLWDHGILPVYQLIPPAAATAGARVSVRTGAESTASPGAPARAASGSRSVRRGVKAAGSSASGKRSARRLPRARQPDGKRQKAKGRA